MKKFIFLIVFLAVVAGALIATCPDRNAHMAAIKSVVSEVVNDEVDKQTNIFTTELASISTVLTVNMADSYLKTNLIIKDHTLYNIGYINYKNELRMVSVGILNHVFTLDKETAREIMKDKMTFPFKYQQRGTLQHRVPRCWGSSYQ